MVMWRAILDLLTYKIQKSVSGSFHQANIIFLDAAGMQCSCNALYAICFSLYKNVSVWKSQDLDYVLEHGDALFKRVVIPRALTMDELPNNVSIEGNNIEIEMLSTCSGLLLGRLFHRTCHILILVMSLYLQLA